LGGSFAKVASLALPHSSSKWAVKACPAALTGRSAKTIELVATPVRVSLSPTRVAPPAFMTIRDGTVCGFTEADAPIVCCSGTCPEGAVVS
jgi:hypothetical protein